MKRLMLTFVAPAIVCGSLMVAPAVQADQTSLITGKACKTIQSVNDNVPGCTNSDPGIASSGGLAYQILNAFMYFAGIVAFIFVIVGGIQYISSDGDATKVSNAKQTLLYAIIGLIITLLAAAIAGFVIKQVVGG